MWPITGPSSPELSRTEHQLSNLRAELRKVVCYWWAGEPTAFDGTPSQDLTLFAAMSASWHQS